jgi:putative hemolysin
LLEEIVGEIMDEYDVGSGNVIEIGADEYLCDGAASLYELNRHLRRPIPPTEFESVSGLLYDCLGRVPKPGDQCEYRGLRLIVERVDNRRIEQVRIVEPPPAEGAEAGRESDDA